MKQVLQSPFTLEEMKFRKLKLLGVKKLARNA